MDSKLKLIILPLWARALATVGAINWGVIGLTGNNIVSLLLGRWPLLVQVTYILIGLSGLYMLLTTRARPLS